MKKFTLFCLPYAGGNSYVYNNWNKSLDKSINFIPVELSGRGNRLQKNLYNSLEEAADDVYNFIKDHIYNSSYAFFGHSMGAKITFEVLHRIKQNQLPLPKHSFFSGSSAPNIREDKIYHTLPDDLFLDRIKDLGGTPQDFFEHEDLVEFYLPILKSDYRISENYVCKEDIAQLDIDFTILTGSEDIFTDDEIFDWKKFTSKECKYKNYEGDHFFIQNHYKDICSLISKTLLFN